MMPLAELLKSILAQASGPSSYPQGNDQRMEIPPMDGEGAGKIMQPDQMQSQMKTPPPGTISNDSGELVDFNFDSNPFKKLLSTNNGQGSISGLLHRFLSPTPEAGNPGGLDTSGTTPRMGGTGDPNHIPGTGQDAVLDPTPMQAQRQKLMQVAPPPVDYSQPTALDPQAIEELRESLLTQSGQMDPGNPNGLSGRMNSMYYPNDKYNQMSEAQQHHDALRGFDGTRSAKLKGRSTQ